MNLLLTPQSFLTPRETVKRYAFFFARHSNILVNYITTDLSFHLQAKLLVPSPKAGPQHKIGRYGAQLPTGGSFQVQQQPPVTGQMYLKPGNVASNVSGMPPPNTGSLRLNVGTPSAPGGALGQASPMAVQTSSLPGTPGVTTPYGPTTPTVIGTGLTPHFKMASLSSPMSGAGITKGHRIGVVGAVGSVVGGDVGATMVGNVGSLGGGSMRPAIGQHKP